MIDPHWLATAAMLTEVPVAENRAGALAEQLGDERELLPWLLVAGAGLTEWPAARAALTDAVKAVIRPRAVTLPPEARSGDSPHAREVVKSALLRALAANAECDRWAADEATRLRARLSACPHPNDFIATN